MASNLEAMASNIICVWSALYVKHFLLVLLNLFHRNCIDEIFSQKVINYKHICIPGPVGIFLCVFEVHTDFQD